jgi:hypothetical protein
MKFTASDSVKGKNSLIEIFHYLTLLKGNYLLFKYVILKKAKASSNVARFVFFHLYLET